MGLLGLVSRCLAVCPALGALCVAPTSLIPGALQESLQPGSASSGPVYRVPGCWPTAPCPLFPVRHPFLSLCLCSCLLSDHHPLCGGPPSDLLSLCSQLGASPKAWLPHLYGNEPAWPEEMFVEVQIILCNLSSPSHRPCQSLGCKPRKKMIIPKHSDVEIVKRKKAPQSEYAVCFMQSVL